MKNQYPKSVAFIGAGLSSCLIAFFLKKSRPDIQVYIFEQSPVPRDSKTWSFFLSDLDSHCRFVRDLADKEWSGCEVRLPHYRRRLEGAYLSLTPESLRKKVEESGIKIRYDSRVESLSPTAVFLNEQRIEFDLVIDGRGLQSGQMPACGYQKFVGQVLRLKEAHGLLEPVIMDVTVPQKDGFRFFYTLPLSPFEVLVEDTRYSRDSVVDADSFFHEIASYCSERSWVVDSVVRTEIGALPIPLEPPASVVSDVPIVGVRGGFFHPVTGYSFADAIRVADRISSLENLSQKSVLRLLEEMTAQRASLNSFYFMLNRMMFLAAEDDERYRIFEHFYELPEGVIQRFFAGTSTQLDRLRILSGRPPVPVLKALKVMLPSNLGARS